LELVGLIPGNDNDQTSSEINELFEEVASDRTEESNAALETLNSFDPTNPTFPTFEAPTPTANFDVNPFPDPFNRRLVGYLRGA
jgi:hypothetical protein